MIQKLVFLSLLLLPGVCFGLMFSVPGNKPQSEANYKQWPKLVDVVNDLSRTNLVWCNGDETLYYRGNTAVINRLLEKFSKVETDELRVILRPELKQPQNHNAHLHIVAGIALASLGEGDDNIPTLTVYLSKEVELNDLVVPQNLVLEQLADVRNRLEKAQKKGSRIAGGALQQIETDAARQGEAAKRYADDLRAIEVWVQNRNSAEKGIKP